MPDEIKYAILNVPLIGQNLAASRTPRLQPSVPAEYNLMLSGEVSRGQWTVDGNGEPLAANGQTVTEHLEFTIKTRPHWLMPAALTDPADETWTSGSLTKQGARLKELEAFCGSKAAALVMLTEEAQRYGVKPFTTEKGTKPGEKRDTKKADEGNQSNNPWSARFNGSEEARSARIEAIIKTGTRFADSMAKSAGTVVSKPLRRAS